jgi:hypothetical protein
MSQPSNQQERSSMISNQVDGDQFTSTGWRRYATIMTKRLIPCKYLGIVLFILGLIPIAMGFGTAGVRPGTIASAIQRSLEPMTRGSWFSTIVAWGMHGYY